MKLAHNLKYGKIRILRKNYFLLLNAFYDPPICRPAIIRITDSAGSFLQYIP